MELVRTPVASAPNEIVATLIERQNGAPMRHITNGRRHRLVGSYYSFKNGRSVAWESRVELRAFYHAEVDPDVTSYRPPAPYRRDVLRGLQVGLHTGSGG